MTTSTDQPRAMGESAWQTVGPFFHTALPWKDGGTLASGRTQGEPIVLAGMILDGLGNPASEAMVEVWQADAAGRFHHPDDPRAAEADPHFSGFGRTVADPDGRFVLRTIRPGRLPGLGNAWQAPHLSLSLYGRGLSGRLVTRVYFAGDPELGDDLVLSSIEPDRRSTLLARPDPAMPGQWLWTARLQGQDETVFFEL